MTRTRRTMTMIASALVAVLVTPLPAFAHGEDGESDPVDSVKQALAIVVNTPAAADEALERVEAALAAEREDPSGELNAAALEAAGAALEEGRLHDAEDSLLEALGVESHTTAAGSDGLTGHGLTERIRGGFRAPSAGDAAALAAAAAVGAAGLLLVRQRRTDV